MSDDEITFIGFRVTGIDERGGVTSRRTKLGFICWTGENVPNLVKAKLSSFTSGVKEYFDGVHLTLKAHCRNDITVKDLEKQLRSAGAAHQVQKYDFRNGYSGEVGGNVTTVSHGETYTAQNASTTKSNDVVTEKTVEKEVEKLSISKNALPDSTDAPDKVTLLITSGQQQPVWSQVSDVTTWVTTHMYVFITIFT